MRDGIGYSVITDGRYRPDASDGNSSGRSSRISFEKSGESLAARARVSIRLRVFSSAKGSPLATSLPAMAQAGSSLTANSKPRGCSSTLCRSGSPRKPAWTSALTTTYRWVPTFAYTKVLPKYLKGTIEKGEFDIKQEKLGSEDLQRL